MLARTRFPSTACGVPPADVPCPPAPSGLRNPGVYPAFKRGFDLLVALVLCLPALPLILLSALLVKLTTRGPAFYWQVRLGLNGRPFWIYKVRTMVIDS